MANKGYWFVVAGAPNLGKTTQVQLLVERLCQQGIPAVRVKYPVYSHGITGPVINCILRKPEVFHRQVPPEQFQRLTARNRRDYEPRVRQFLESGTTVIAEDYTITGLVHGEYEGVDPALLREINSSLGLPDKGILMSGPRFTTTIEGHRTETHSTEHWNNIAEIHARVAAELGYETISSEGTIEQVQERLWNCVHGFIREQLNHET